MENEVKTSYWDMDYAFFTNIFAVVFARFAGFPLGIVSVFFTDTKVFVAIPIVAMILWRRRE